MVARVRRDRRIASAATLRSPRTRVIAGLDRGVRTCPHGQSEVRRGEGGRVVDAVTDHRDGTSLGTQTLDDVHLLLRQHLRVHLTDAHGTGDGFGHGPVVPGQQDGPEAEPPQFRDGFRARLLDRVGDPEDAACRTAPGDHDRGASLRRRVGHHGGQGVGHVDSGVGEQPRTPHEDGMALDDAPHAEPRRADGLLDGGQRRTGAPRRPRRRRPGRRGARRRAPARPRAAAARSRPYHLAHAEACPNGRIVRPRTREAHAEESDIPPAHPAGDVPRGGTPTRRSRGRCRERSHGCPP